MRALRRLPPLRAAAEAASSEREQSALDAEIDLLENASLEELQLDWRNRWGRLAPAHIPRGLLFRLMAYRIQAEAFGDLDRKSLKRLDRLAHDSGRAAATSEDGLATLPRMPGRPARAVAPPAMILKPGAVLTREWRGRIERVMALEKGFAWNGKTYSSLSAVALSITGVKWNGPRFFFGNGRDGRAQGKVAQSHQPSDVSRQPPEAGAAT
jgi:hypothetical protein